MSWRDWYDSLAKPSWTPAPATIGLIWWILYPIILVTCGYVFVQAIRGNLSWWVALPIVVIESPRPSSSSAHSPSKASFRGYAAGRPVGQNAP
jgi:hypothetical protein